MAITQFGKAIRRARIDADVNLSTMAEHFGVTAAFLSSLESGRKNISDEWLRKIEAFFQERGIRIDGLRELADVSNKVVPLDGLAPDQQRLVSAFARSASPELFAKVEALLKKGI